jgi:hypothetical protein
MKKLVLTALVLFLGLQMWAQEKDSLQMNIGKNKITIYNEDAKELEALKKSQKDFTDRLKALKDSVSQIKIELNGIQEESVKAQIEKTMAEFEKQIDAYKKGIDDLQMEIEKLNQGNYSEENEIGEMEEENNQDFEDPEDAPKIHSKKKFKGHWGGFEFGLNNFVNSNQKMELPSDGGFMELNTNKSWEFALNFIEFNIPLFSRYTGLVTGMGVEWNGYEFKRNIKLQEDPDGIIYGQDMSNVNFQKNKLNVTYLKVPLIFEVQLPVSHKDHRVFLGAGVTTSVKLRAKTKQYYEINGKEQKDKIVDDYQLNPLNYGLTARLGYRNIRLFGNYSLTPLFEKNQGPELYPFSVGISLINF